MKYLHTQPHLIGIYSPQVFLVYLTTTYVFLDTAGFMGSEKKMLHNEYSSHFIHDIEE